jgi:hypothetical protein
VKEERKQSLTAIEKWLKVALIWMMSLLNVVISTLILLKNQKKAQLDS